MTIDYENKIKGLEERIKILEKKYVDMESVSTFPLTIENSLKGRGFLKYLETLFFYGGASGNVTKLINVESKDGKNLITVSDTFKQFIVNTTTDVCNCINHGFSDDMQVLLFSTGDLPAGLDLAAPYYIKNSTANTFKLSADNINIADITSDGTGTHYIDFLT